MKKTILFFILLMLGITVLTGCDDKGESFKREVYTVDSELIKKIEINVQDRLIEVSSSDDNQIHIDYSQNSKEYYNISVSDAHLVMTADNSKEWTDYIGVKPSEENRIISLRIPDKLLDTLILSTTNEDIKLCELSAVGNISVSVSGGNISFGKLDADHSITLISKNGNISGLIIGSYDDFDITCETKKGKSNLPSDKQGGSKILKVSNNNGDTDIEFSDK